jgi:hypothetical protein
MRTVSADQILQPGVPTGALEESAQKAVQIFFGLEYIVELPLTCSRSLPHSSHSDFTSAEAHCDTGL